MGRMLILVYGVLSYFMFVGTFLYAFAWVGGFYVPTTAGGGMVGSFTQALIINAALLGLFAVQHTIMARPAFKKWWTNIIPAAAERSTFVLITNLILILMFWQWRPMGGLVWDLSAGTLGKVLWGVYGLGWLTVFISSFFINHFDIFGLRQVYLHFTGKEYSDLPFKTPGLYGMVRHPMMMGFLIAFWAIPTMTAANLFFAIATTGYIIFGVHMEERDLVNGLGDDYRTYQKQVSMLLPIPKRKSA